MNIAICDDNLTELRQTAEVINNVYSNLDLEYMVDEYVSGYEFLENIKNYDVIFLDIELKNSGINGIEVAKRVKTENLNCIIIFVTNYEEYIDDVIDEYAFRFWQKPIEEYRLKKSVNVILERMKSIQIKENKTKKTMDIPVKNIIYITPKKRNCRIIMTDGEIVSVESFRDIKDRLLAGDFCECHGSYCVNLNYVEGYDKSCVYLCNNSQKYMVDMSRRYYTSFKESMFITGGSRV